MSFNPLWPDAVFKTVVLVGIVAMLVYRKRKGRWWWE